MHKVPVGVLGASGYAGRELCALAAAHPGLDLVFASANEQRGHRARFAGEEVTFVALEDAPLGSAEIVFSALPHGASAAWVANARGAGARVVDLSADFRPGTNATGTLAPYGLTELVRDEIPGSEIIANPGCYPTAILLGVAPLFREALVLPGGVINISAASGVTGAGYGARHELMFAELAEDFRAYAVGNAHRHLPEMQAMVQKLGGKGNDILFTPHLLPVARGILATITIPLTRPIADPASIWRKHYGTEPFIEISDTPPTLRDVVRRNVVRISATMAENLRQPTVIVIAAIDNLIKGAAGQAIQNANVLLGIEERTGLPL